MKQADVLILIEHTARELDISCVVKYLLGRLHGLSCEVASLLTKEGYPDSIEDVRPRVVATPYFFDVKSHLGLLQVAPDWGELTILNLSYEQVLAPWNQLYRKPTDDFTRQRVIHHVWGPQRATALREAGVDERCIAVNGSQALGLYGPEYSPFFTNRATLAQRYGLDASLRWVFIPDQYEAAFFPQKQVDAFISRGVDPALAQELCDFDRRSFGEAARWWAEAARASNLEVILRPRPAVPLDAFQNALEEELGGPPPPELHVLKQGSVREWILASDVVTSSHSTTLLEAAWAKKQVVMFCPFEYPPELWFDWCDAAPRATTQAEFLEAIQAPLSEAGWSSLRAWAREHVVQNTDPLGGLAQLIADLCKGRREAPPTPQPGVDFEVPPPPEAPIFFDPELPESVAGKLRRRIGEGWAAYWKRIGIDPLAPAGQEANGLGRLKELLPAAAVERLVALSKGHPLEPTPEPPSTVNPKHEQDSFGRTDVLDRVAAWSGLLDRTVLG